MAHRRQGSGPQSNYITPEGRKKLMDEIDHLWTVERPKITQEVAEAAAHGDRSDNAEYRYGKHKLRDIDQRLGFLANRIEQLIVIDPCQSAADRVRFGAWVTLEDEGGAGTIRHGLSDFRRRF